MAGGSCLDHKESVAAIKGGVVIRSAAAATAAVHCAPGPTGLTTAKLCWPPPLYWNWCVM